MWLRLFRCGPPTVLPGLGQGQWYAGASISPAAPLGLRFSLGTRHTAQKFGARPFKKVMVVMTAGHRIFPVGSPGGRGCIVFPGLFWLDQAKTLSFLG